jgi:hypothetical protein
MSSDGLTIDEFWIYWILKHTTCDRTLQIITHIEVSPVFVFMPSGNGIQRRKFPFLWVPMSPCFSHGNSQLRSPSLMIYLKMTPHTDSVQ